MSHCKSLYFCKCRNLHVPLFYRIPKNATIRTAWIQFCGLKEELDDISTVQICSKHFTQNDYVEPRAKELGHHLILRPNSVPSILVPLCQKDQHLPTVSCNLQEATQEAHSGKYLYIFELNRFK